MKQNRQKSIQKRMPQTLSRPVLWNIVQPGDPYDIRKSMIARLPQHPPIFMGQHLELICLFQGAQIQRMTQYMQQMTIKIRQFQRIQLDRHSYEVQIKQLAEKLTLLNGIKIENEKLKDFIKRQSEQMQILQKNRHSSQSFIQLQTNYEKVLNELRIDRQNNNALSKSNSQLLKQISELRFQNQKSQKMLFQEKSKFQREIKFQIQKAVTQYRISVQNRQYQLKGQINVMKENLTLKNREIQIQKSKNALLSKQLSQKQNQLGQYQRGQIVSQGSKAQQVLKISKRLQQTTYLLQKSQKQSIDLKTQLEYLRRKVKSIQEQYKARQFQLRTQLQKHNQPQSYIKISQLQAKNKLLMSQIQRLNLVSEKRVKQISQKDKEFFVLKDKIIGYERRIQFLERQSVEKDNRLRKQEAEWQKFQEKDIKIEHFAKEINRLNIVLSEKLKELENLESMVREYHKSQAHHSTIYRSKEETIHILESRTKQYEMKLMSLQEANRLNFDQINRLNLRHTQLQNENIRLRRQIDLKVQNSIEKSIVQNNRLVEELNQKNVENRKLREDNEQMFRQISELRQNLKYMEGKGNDQVRQVNKIIQQKVDQLNNQRNAFSIKEKSYIQKLEMYQKSMPQLSQQIQRLHQVLQRKQNQNTNLLQQLERQRTKIKSLQKKTSTQYQMSILQYQKKISFLQAKCSSLQKMNHQISHQKSSKQLKLSSLQLALNQTSQQLQRLKNILKVRETSFQSMVNQYKTQNINIQSQLLKSRQEVQFNFQKLRGLQFQLDKAVYELGHSRNQLGLVKEQNNRLKLSLEEAQNEKKIRFREFASLQKSNEGFTTQISGLNHEKQLILNELNQKKNKLSALQQSYEKLNIKVFQYQQTIRHTEQANSIKLQESIRRIQQDHQHNFREINMKYQQLSDKNTRLERKLKEQQESKKKNFVRINQLEKQLSQKIEHINDYKNRILLYEQKIALLSQQLDRLTQTIKQLKEKLQNQRTKYYEQQREHQRHQYQHASKQNQSIQQLINQLQQAKIQVTNLKIMIQEYESINEHSIAQRDELFHISHEQKEKITQLSLIIQNYKNQRSKYSFKQSSNVQEINLIKEQYNSLLAQFSNLQKQNISLQDQYQGLLFQLQAARKQSVNKQQSIKRQQYRFKQYETQINKITEQYETALRVQRQKNTEYFQNMEKQSRALLIIEQKNNQLEVLIKELRLEVQEKQTVIQQFNDIKTQFINTKLENEELNRILEQLQEQLFEAREQNKKVGQREGSELIKVKQELYRARQDIYKLKQENNSYRNQMLEYKDKYSIIQPQITSVYHQIEMIKKQTQIKIFQIQSLYSSCQQQNVQLKQQIDSLSLQVTNQTLLTQQISLQWQTKYNTLYQAYNQTYAIYNEMKAESQILKQNLFNYKEHKIPMLQEQFNKLNVLIAQLSSQKQVLLKRVNEDGDLITKNLQLQQEIQRLQVVIKNLKQEIGEVRIRLANDNSLQKRIQEDMALMVVLFAEIQTLRRRVEETEKQCQDVRRNSISPFKVRK